MSCPPEVVDDGRREAIGHGDAVQDPGGLAGLVLRRIGVEHRPGQREVPAKAQDAVTHRPRSGVGGVVHHGPEDADPSIRQCVDAGCGMVLGGEPPSSRQQVRHVGQGEGDQFPTVDAHCAEGPDDVDRDRIVRRG